MKTAIAILTAGLLVLGGLVWAQTEPGKHSGMMQQQSAATGSQAGATPDTPRPPMQATRARQQGHDNVAQRQTRPGLPCRVWEA